MTTCRPVRFRVPAAAWVSGIILILCACCVHANLNENICQSVRDSLSDTRLYFFNLNLDENEHINTTWPAVTYSEETVRVLDGICNVTVLHNLAEHVSDTEKCRSSHLQEKACCWLYNTESPNITLCTSELNEYCFQRISWGHMNKLYVDFTKSIRCNDARS